MVDTVLKMDYIESCNVVDMSKDDEDVLSGTSDGDAENKQPEGLEGSESDNQQASSGLRKKPRRRGKHKGGKHHRKWKPYNKLTWSERKELEERETIRATMKREEAFASGHPVAPYNTTQFLIDDHIQSEVSPNLVNKENDANGVGIGKNAKDGSFGTGSGESSEDFNESADEDDMFLAREFSETYDNIHAERLQMMSKEELIKDYLEMERRVEKLERHVKDGEHLKSVSRDGSTGDRDSSDGQSLSSSGEEPIDLVSVKKIEQQIKLLKDENTVLKAEIGRLLQKKSCQ